MMTNHLKLAFRNIIKRKGYTLLNIAGLTIGMSSCLLIFHYVSFERSYDTFEPAAENIYRFALLYWNKLLTNLPDVQVNEHNDEPIENNSL